MKTVADFKRALAVGKQLKAIYHAQSKKDEQGNVIRLEDGLPEYCDLDLGTRNVSIVQSTQFALEREIEGKMTNSWCKFPKASECSIEGDSITIFEEHRSRGRVPILTYTLVP